MLYYGGELIYFICMWVVQKLAAMKLEKSYRAKIAIGVKISMRRLTGKADIDEWTVLHNLHNPFAEVALLKFAINQLSLFLSIFFFYRINSMVISLSNREDFNLRQYLFNIKKGIAFKIFQNENVSLWTTDVFSALSRLESFGCFFFLLYLVVDFRRVFPVKQYFFKEVGQVVNMV